MNKFTAFLPKLTVSLVWFFFVLAGSQAYAASETKDPFVRYSGIEPNIKFWKKIFSHYKSTQGVLHDQNNLAIIYEVIELEPRDKPRSGATNKSRIETAKKKLQDTLNKLATGATPTSDTEKKIVALFGADASPAEFKQAAANLRFQQGTKEQFEQEIQSLL